MFETIPDYRKIVILIFEIKNDEVLLKDCGFLKNNMNRLNVDFKDFFTEQNE